MSGNSFGKCFVVTTAGESHGPGYVAIIDGCPARLSLHERDIQKVLDRRRPGQSRFTSSRQELDRVSILSGIFEGKTTGTPIALFIANEDARSEDYADIQHVFRPGHGDYTYFQKYGIRDYRGGGRASARETMMRVAAGAIAQKYLYECLNIHIVAYTTDIGTIQAKRIDLTSIHDNPFFFADPDQVTELEKLICQLSQAGDSIGARLQVRASGVPAGLGEPVFEKLDAAIASAMMGINAVKGVEIGTGILSAKQTGSAHRDEMNREGFLSNHAGGMLAGISTGQDICANISFKPTSSIAMPAKTVDKNGIEQSVVTRGRHDPCVAIRAGPIVEAMLALVLIDFYLRDQPYRT